MSAAPPRVRSSAVRVVLPLLLTACAAPVERTALVLDAPGARTLVVFQSVDGAVPTTLVLDAADLSRLPTTTQDDGTAIDTWIVAYPLGPAELGLTPGPLLPAAADTPSRPLPRPLLTFGAHYSGSAQPELALEPLPAPPEPIARFRYTVPCPAAADPRTTRDVIPGCSLPFPARDAICYGPATPLPGLDAEGDDDVGSAVREGDRTWLYFTSSRFGQDSFSRHGRVRMLDPTTPDLTSITELPTLPRLQKSGPEWIVRGWSGVPWVRPDGLEMMFTSSYPDRDWQDEDSYVSVRAALDLPWPLGTNTIALGSALLEHDPVANPIMLADRRTAVWRSADGLVHGWRPSSAAGAQGFVSLGRVLDTAGQPLGDASGITTSCDGGHLLYQQRGEPWIARIVAMPSSFDEPPVGTLVVEPRRLEAAPGFAINSLSEAPDCAVLYVSDHDVMHVAPRIPCP